MLERNNQVADNGQPVMTTESDTFQNGAWPSSNLSRARDGWDEIDVEEIRLLRAMTVEESLGHYLGLQRAFETQLQLTESLFRAQRQGYLQDLQNRLRRLAVWMKKQRG